MERFVVCSSPSLRRGVEQIVRRLDLTRPATVYLGGGEDRVKMEVRPLGRGVTRLTFSRGGEEAIVLVCSFPFWDGPLGFSLN